ncbi:type II toxin-antitoxin system RelE/ParE family toxin [candidate division KSB1 bacterium]|nr:type II toxin-antitoxin system RelE/ParE family toxin [candidate division KSB1 bacterium]
MKNVRLIYTEEFTNSFLETIEYIKQESPNSAKLFARKVSDKIKLLKTFPEIGKQSEDFRLAGIRILIIGNYLILYEYIQKEKLVYLHLFCHGARDYQNIFKDLK